MRTNVINVPLVAGRVARPMPAWQYDYGLELHFSGADLPEYFQVHFSNTDESGTATTAIGSSDAVVVPSQYLQSGNTIYAWLYLHSGNADGETVYKIELEVKKRAQPTDEEPTPEEQSEIDALITALSDGVTRAETAAENAATSASAAMDAAADVDAGVEVARGYAQDAQLSEHEAQASAESALEAQGEAAQSAEMARLYAESASRASGYSTQAQQSAIAAAASADTAHTQAHNAAISAESALQYSEDAGASASAAAESAARAAESVAGGGYINLWYDDEHLYVELANVDELTFAAQDERLVVIYG